MNITRTDLKAIYLTGDALAIVMDELHQIGWSRRRNQSKARKGVLAKKARKVVREINSFSTFPRNGAPYRDPFNCFGFWPRKKKSAS